jgi:hypothetical protein
MSALVVGLAFSRPLRLSDFHFPRFTLYPTSIAMTRRRYIHTHWLCVVCRAPDGVASLEWVPLAADPVKLPPPSDGATKNATDGATPAPQPGGLHANLGLCPVLAAFLMRRYRSAGAEAGDYVYETAAPIAARLHGHSSHSRPAAKAAAAAITALTEKEKERAAKRAAAAAATAAGQSSVSEAAALLVPPQQLSPIDADTGTNGRSITASAEAAAAFARGGTGAGRGKKKKMGKGAAAPATAPMGHVTANGFATDSASGHSSPDTDRPASSTTTATAAQRVNAPAFVNSTAGASLAAPATTSSASAGSFQSFAQRAAAAAATLSKAAARRYKLKERET